MIQRPALIVTTAQDVHADAVILELQARKVPVFRFHPEDFPATTAVSLEFSAGQWNGTIADPYRTAGLDHIRSAWYRRPAAPRMPEGVVAGAEGYCATQALETLRCMYEMLEGRWVVSPRALRLAEVKTAQLERAHELGLLTPPTLISNEPNRCSAFRHQVGKCAVKAIRVEGVQHEERFWFPLTTVWESESAVEESSASYAPTVYQTYIEKALELRCVVVGSAVFAGSIDSQARPESVHDVRGRALPEDAFIPRPERPRYERFDLPESIGTALVTLVNSFGIHSASVDMILTPSGEYVFIELNPNGQWLWIEFDTGAPIAAEMANLLTRGVSHG